MINATIFGVARGNGKSLFGSYLKSLDDLYKANKITKEKYIAMIGALRVLIFGHSENTVLEWMKNAYQLLIESEKGEEK